MNNTRILMTGILMACTTLVQAEFSTTTMLTTDYVFRGISNTDGDPAIQGSMDYEHETGFYAGIWASNVKFRENAGVDAIDTVDEASIEIDYYTGFASEFANGVSWDLGALYYSYPGSEKDLDYDYWEAMGALGYAFEDVTLEPEIGAELYFSPEYFGNSGDATYATAILSLSLPREFGLNFSVGRQSFKDSSDLNYNDWKAGITRALWGFDFEIAYIDTDLSKADCDDEEICDDRVVFSIASSFE